jgi:hypothetical protein
MPRPIPGARIAGGSMPIVRYFVFVGGLLLAPLFAADRYLPEVPERFAAGDVDRTIIRIRSARPLCADQEDRGNAQPGLVFEQGIVHIPEHSAALAISALSAAISALGCISVGENAGKRTACVR